VARFLTDGRKNRKRENSRGIIHFPAGTDLDSSSRYVYLLRGGKVRVSHGSEAIIEHLVPGNFFGEECLISRRQHFQVARCLSPVTVSAFRPSDLLDRVQQDRHFASRLLSNLALRLNRRGQTVRDFVTEPAERRLALLLSRLVLGKRASGWVRVPFNTSNAELARTVGTTRWRISHFMRKFNQLGWLERRPEVWVLREGLRKFLEPAARDDLRREPRSRP
jgi:CRP-like cAMP-binding protein